MQNCAVRRVKRPYLSFVLMGILAGLIVSPLPIVVQAAAQTGKGTLSGVVLAAGGAPAKTATVFYQSADGSAPHVLRTDASGHFHSRVLRAGLYDVRAEAGGKWSDWAHNVIVPSGGGENLTLRLVRGTAPGQ